MTNIERVKKEVYFREDTVIEDILAECFIDNERQLPWKAKGFFEEGSDHYFWKGTQKDLAAKYGVTTTRIGRLFLFFQNSKIMIKLGVGDYAVDYNWFFKDNSECA